MDLSPTPEENIVVLTLSIFPTLSLDSTNSQVSTNSQERTRKVVKRFYCQRCQNHGEYFNRKVHKPFCQWAGCQCYECQMIEGRRQYSARLARAQVRAPLPRIVNGKKIREPKCARCEAHNVTNSLRGHTNHCPFKNCPCDLCSQVEKRRKLMLMSLQIRLRKIQDKERKRRN